MWKKRTAAQDYLIIVLGAFIMGFAIKNIYDPQGLVTGGVSGLAIILKDQAGIPLWITNMCVNVPLFFPLPAVEGVEICQAGAGGGGSPDGVPWPSCRSTPS